MSNIRITRAIRIALGLLRQEMGSVRVIMGYLLGFTVLALGLNDFLRYAVEIEEPVNIFEAFIIVESQGTAGRLWVLGYLLILANAPFVKRNTYIILYRSGRRIWNMGMLLYVFIQAFMYTMCFAAASTAVSVPYGFSGKIWRSPAYMLATGASHTIAEKYHVSFEGMALMKHMTVLQAFGITFMYMFCYFVFLGVLLYVCNLMFGGFWGLAAVAVVHLGRVILSFTVKLHQSPVYYVDGSGGYWRYPCIMMAFIFAMAAVSLFAVERVDIQAR